MRTNSEEYANKQRINSLEGPIHKVSGRVVVLSIKQPNFRITKTENKVFKFGLHALTKQTVKESSDYYCGDEDKNPISVDQEFYE